LPKGESHGPTKITAEIEQIVGRLMNLSVMCVGGRRALQVSLIIATDALLAGLNFDADLHPDEGEEGRDDAMPR
jgi:hypothetical protein